MRVVQPRVHHAHHHRPRSGRDTPRQRRRDVRVGQSARLARVLHVPLIDEQRVVGHHRGGRGRRMHDVVRLRELHVRLGAQFLHQPRRRLGTGPQLHQPLAVERPRRADVVRAHNVAVHLKTHARAHLDQYFIRYRRMTVDHLMLLRPTGQPQQQSGKNKGNRAPCSHADHTPDRHGPGRPRTPPLLGRLRALHVVSYVGSMSHIGRRRATFRGIGPEYRINGRSRHAGSIQCGNSALSGTPRGGCARR